MFYYLYCLLAASLHLIFTPVLFALSFKRKYKKSIPARFFLLNNLPFKEGGVHFHVCSLGEANAIKPLIESLNSKDIRLSTTTNTGFEAIKKYKTKEIRFLPFETFLPFWIKPQKVLVVFEAELWYMLFAVSKKKGAKTFLINARISEKSYPRYYRFKWLYKKIFENIDVVYAQSFEDARRLKTLGAHNIKVNGNIKFFNLAKPDAEYPKRKRYDSVVCAASTHEGEEELIFNAFLELKRKENAQLIVVPRHPERFDEVEVFLAREARKRRLSFAKFSEDKSFKSDIVLVDAMGELINIYAISDVAVLGGAFANIGGHNAAEAAQFGCRIISGPNYFNQKDIFKSIEGIKIVPEVELADALVDFRDLTPAKIDTNAKIDELLEDIKNVLR